MNLTEQSKEDITDMVIESRDVEELTADEMFENLRYKKQDGDDCWLEYYKNSYERTKIIEFELNEHYIFVQTNEGDSMPINLKELKAINEKVRELGWLDE